MRDSCVKFSNSFCIVVLKFRRLSLPPSETLVNDVNSPQKNGHAHTDREDCIWSQDVTGPSPTPP